MRAVILADTSFSIRERSMLSRLEVGLADEGVRVIHALPQRAASWHQPGVFSQPAVYLDEGLPLSLRWRVQKFALALEALAGPTERPADIVHIFGEHAWEFGCQLASQLGAALALEVWCANLARRAVRVRSGPEHSPAACLAPSEAIETMVREHDPAAPVRVTPWGVHTPPAPREILSADRVWSALILGSGRDSQAMLAALEGLAGALGSHPELMTFADAEAVTSANLWPSVKRLGILDRFTMIPDVEARRDPVLRMDILICPEARGEYRSIVLDAMATGMLVIAAADPAVSYLIDGTTAKLVEGRTAEAWKAAIETSLQNPAASRDLAQNARAYVRENCRASGHVAAVMDVYEWLTAGETIPFQTP
jgi:glycosyltransferase involved in cell wall biosynthesis